MLKRDTKISVTLTPLFMTLMLPARISSIIPTTTTAWFLCVTAIFFLSIFGRSVQHWLFSIVSRDAILPTVVGLTSLIGIFLYQNRKRLALRLPALIAAGTLLTMGILAVYLKFLRPIELTHFFLFSSLGWFSVSAFGIRKGALMVILIATGDEILQHFLPGRVGDLHDILINNTSGLVGVFLGSNKEKNQTP